ncbi:hypothetical protein ILUMI_04331 [Ignelater luminosus]|uniref:PiggyBac transposable element-derived protein domain-containing protein n=1 Tax=Ignelater luminosus TaxID=2038154 RepID=A0A8K0DD24_IGNLU|nr:hypothetical protein ILUMI_04331 [Ignelater luminosus]
MPYEAEQDHLLLLLREVEEGEDPIDEESDPEVDNVRKRTEKRIPSKKETPKTRKCNIVTPLPGVRPCAESVTTVSKCWNLSFCDEILEILVENTIKRIQSQRDNFSRPRDAKSTDLDEMKALLGPLYLAGVLRSSRSNVDDL